MQSKAGHVTFNIEFEQKDDGLHATLINATDRQPFSSAVFKDGVITLRMDYYDGALTLHYTSFRVHRRASIPARPAKAWFTFRWWSCLIASAPRVRHGPDCR